MRYMINMAYSADLPINSMGRRIRTRLYFTSESHLHTVLNVLRFAGEKHPLLSERGLAIINATPELCYLTQIVMRVFEDSRFPMVDPRRFRVEILFSPGATAKPTSLPEADRDLDTSRNQTEPLQMIGREGLTCKEVEDFFSKAIKEGGSSEELSEGMIRPSSELPLTKQTDEELIKRIVENVSIKTPKISNQTDQALAYEPSSTISSNIPRHELYRKDSDSSQPQVKQSEPATLLPAPERVPTNVSDDTASVDDMSQEDEKDIIPTILSRKYLWGSVAVGSVVLGMSCLLFAFTMSSDPRPRRWSTRKH